MKVSIIIPTYNRAHLLTQTINSILNQTFKDFEIIIVDNCSKDNTEITIRDYIKIYPQIRYFSHPNNGIVAVNRNFGIRQAIGDYIAFCDDDDLWRPQKLQLQVAELDQDPNIGLICTAGFYLANGRWSGRSNFFSENDFSFQSILHHNKILTSSVILRKSVLENTGLFDETRELIAVEDYDLWIRVAKTYKIKYLNLPLIIIRIHNRNYSGTTSFQFSMEYYKKMSLLYRKYETDFPSSVKSALYYYLKFIRRCRIETQLEQRKIKLFPFLLKNMLPLEEKIVILFEYLRTRHSKKDLPILIIKERRIRSLLGRLLRTIISFFLR